MEDLIFVLPTLIIFFFIIFQILAFFKRGFDFVRKNFDLTIDQAGEEIKKKGSQAEENFDQNELENRIAEAEKKSLAESKDRILKRSRTNSRRDNAKNKKDKQINDNLDQKELSSKKSSSLGEIFAQYNEVEKAVIYKEVLSKPKALKKD
ncbi:hypothetical protein C7957_11060 [Halanaerobium saccharolyticum]|uniref:Uncharacterized protein n=1 Tax=Halanaerobium saccharolyticum TaxID=43595 RepID=A0A4R6S5V5_9FIRM|nr:hypothetical protein [Halanaerobium saccharolyticum]TDP94723.1 hypothetical protein C7957_11060 [Halanaerobium saccharolyticum]